MPSTLEYVPVQAEVGEFVVGSEGSETTTLYTVR